MVPPLDRNYRTEFKDKLRKVRERQSHGWQVRATRMKALSAARFPLYPIRMQLPPPTYLTAQLPGTGGQIKQHLEDFQVEEIPAYPAAGVGTHCYLKIEKRGFSTMAAADILAKLLGRKNIDIGYAGLKDKQAVTSQWFSVEHLDTSRAKSMELPTGMKVVEITRHRNKIKRGHLAGNKFIIKIRNPEWSRVGVNLDEPAEKAQAVLEAMEKTGAPNFFGPQRFGMRGDNHLLGLALLRGDAK